MNDTVTKILELVSEYAEHYAEDRNWGTFTADTTKARQALQDELVRLFAALTDDQMEVIANAADRRFLACMNESDGWWAVYGRMLEAEHGTGEKND